jgi:penicillin amidase
MIRILAIAVALATLTHTGSAQVAATSLQVAGLSQPVEILRDRWGINHIYAQNEGDLFFAQGYAAARDRLFQFEVWRRQATGTVAEILGRRELMRDRGARLHMFRGDLDADLNRYHPRGKAIVEAYVRGVNAYIAETERNPALLPVEFKMLGIKPGRFTPAVVISRHQALTSNVGEEVRLLRAIKSSSVDAVRELMTFQGGNPRFEVDPAIDVSVFPDNVLETYSAFRESVQFRPEDVGAEWRGTSPAAAAVQRGLAPSLSEHDTAPDPAGPADLEADARDIGSNNWVVAGSRTFSTRPMLANDPHRVIAAPSLRYWVHLSAPGWNVIGGGEPILPGVSIGHNEHGAWGLTIYGQDAEDLYVYDTNPANPNEYRYRGAWEPMRVIADTIAIKGEQPATVELKYTRHGPVLFEDRANRKAYALRAGWLEPGGAPAGAAIATWPACSAVEAASAMGKPSVMRDGCRSGPSGLGRS